MDDFFLVFFCLLYGWMVWIYDYLFMDFLFVYLFAVQLFEIFEALVFFFSGFFF